MVEKEMPIAKGRDEAEDRMPAQTISGILAEAPRSITEKLAEQLMGSQEREIERLAKLLEESKNKIAA